MKKFGEDIFYKKKADKNKLIEYGFNFENNVFKLERKILDQFLVKLSIVNNNVNGELYDIDTGDLFTMLDMEKATGSFVGKVRDAYRELLLDIEKNCFHETTYNSEQANRLNEYIIKKYKIYPDFPWEKYADYGVYRNQTNNLWFGLIMEVGDNKLAPNVKSKTVINIKPPKEMFNFLLEKNNIYPGWHMNKKSWLSISLDDSFDDEFVFGLVDLSYLETIGKEMVRLFPPKKKKQ